MLLKLGRVITSHGGRYHRGRFEGSGGEWPDDHTHGDSSTYAAIKEKVPWGRDDKKIECANHACKCLRSNLEKLADANRH